MTDLEHVHSLTDFLRDHETHLARLRETRMPEVLTVDGKAEVVMIDVESFHEIRRKLHHIETVEAIKAGLEAVERGEHGSLEEFEAEMKREYGV